MRVRADFGGALAIFANHVDRWRSPATVVDASIVLEDRHKILFLVGVQQVAWNGRKVQEGSFHVFTVSLSLPFATTSVCVCFM